MTASRAAADDPEPYVTVGEALEGLPSIDAGEAAANVPNHVAPNHGEAMVERIASTEWGGYLYENSYMNKRLHPDEPAPTIAIGDHATWQRAHPYDDRGLTIRERARLQSFPDWVEFAGGRNDQAHQTGNAVPPKLTEVIGRQLRRNLNYE